MIATYMDRCDAASGYRPAPSRPVHEDPRFYNGGLYASVIDRMADEARAALRWAVGNDAVWHKRELRHGIRMGEQLSWWRTDGKRKGA